MKITKKVTSLLLVMLLALSTFAVAITATAASEIDLVDDVQLTITKYAKLKNSNPITPNSEGQAGTGYENKAITGVDKMPTVKGAEFSFFKVGNLSEQLTSSQLENAVNNPPEKGSYHDGATSADADIVMKTGDNGTVTRTFTKAEYGLYYVVETSAPELINKEGKTPNFYVYVPMTDTVSYPKAASESYTTNHVAGRTYNDNMFLYPKNIFTTVGAYATKVVDEDTYASRIQLQRISKGPEIQLHVEKDGFDSSKPGVNEQTVATFVLASTPKGEGADGKPQFLKNASVKLGASATVVYAGGKDQVEIEQLASNLYAKGTQSYNDVTDTGLGLDFQSVSATVTNDGYMIVNGLPSGYKYHWSEKVMTEVFAQKANPGGAGFVNDYTATPQTCTAAVNTQDGLIGSNRSFTVDSNYNWSEYQYNDDTHDVTLKSGSDLTNNIKENIIENTIGFTVTKETLNKTENVFQNPSTAGTTDEHGKFSYNVGDAVPYRLDVKIPKDVDQVVNNVTNTITLTDTTSKGLEFIQNAKFRSNKLKGLNNLVAGEAKTFFFQLAAVSTTGEAGGDYLDINTAVYNNSYVATTEISPDNANTEGQKVTFTFTKDNLKSILQLAKDGFGDDKYNANSIMLYIYYEGVITDAAAPGPEPNTLVFANDATTSTTILNVYSGGFMAKKEDASSAAKVVQGAKYDVKLVDGSGDSIKFSLYSGDGEKQSVEPSGADQDEINAAWDALGDYYYVYDSAGTITELTTDKKGYIRAKGLEYGDYTLTETYSPADYELSIEPTTVTVGDGTYATAQVKTMTDVHSTTLPLTGGMGTIIFTVVGLALIGGAAFFFIRSRRNKEDEA